MLTWRVDATSRNVIVTLTPPARTFVRPEQVCDSVNFRWIQGIPKLLEVTTNTYYVLK